MTIDERAERLIQTMDLGNEDQWLSMIRSEMRCAVGAGVAEERENCAMLAETIFDEQRLFEGRRDGGEVIASAIRAR